MSDALPTAVHGTPRTARFGIATTHLDGTILSADDIYASFCGVPAAEIRGRNIRDFADEGGGYSTAAVQNLLLRSGQPVQTVRDYVTPSGERTRCCVQLCILRDPAGEPEAILAVVQAA